MSDVIYNYTASVSNKAKIARQLVSSLTLQDSADYVFPNLGDII